MIKKTVSYTDFNGEKQVEDLYFHLTEAELAEVQFKAGDLTNRVQVLMATGRRGAVMDWFKEIVIKGYGQRSDDGSRFIKSQEVIDAFVYSNAFSALVMEILSDPNAALEFVAGMSGKKVSDLSIPEEQKAKLGITTALHAVE